jgi:hypothetical protein
MISRARSGLSGMSRENHAEKESFLALAIRGERFPLSPQAIQMERQHRLQSVQRFRDVRAIVRELQRRDLGDDTASFWVLLYDHTVFHGRRRAHVFSSP